MSNIFEDFNFEEPIYLDTSVCETDDQRYLKERYASFATRNALELAMFDPEVSESYTRMFVSSGVRIPDSIDPQLAYLLKQQMLNAIGLNIPKSDESEFISHRVYKSGKHAYIFTVNRDQGPFVPVYFSTQKDGVTPERVDLLSYDKAQELVLLNRDLDEYRSKLRQKLGTAILDKAVGRLNIEDLKWFNAVYDDLQKIPTLDSQ